MKIILMHSGCEEDRKTESSAQVSELILQTEGKEKRKCENTDILRQENGRDKQLILDGI